MPPAKLKPSDIASEAKKTYIPYVLQNFSSQFPPTSTLCFSESMINPPHASLNPQYNTRFAFFDRDPVDAAIEWYEGPPPQLDEMRIPVIMPANDKRPGGDWEAGVMMPEECLCRRSNLYATLTTPAYNNPDPSNYPLPSSAGIYSSHVVVFRDGPDKYEPWTSMKHLPVISVCPVKRPKLDKEGRKYSFDQEKELMREKIITALRIAKWHRHADMVIGTFGLGSGFRNPAEEVAKMWRHAFLRNPEFIGFFRDVVFAFEDPEGPSSSSSSSKASPSKSSSSKISSSKSSSKSSSSKSSSSSRSSAAADLDIFRDIFKPSKIHGFLQS